MCRVRNLWPTLEVEAIMALRKGLESGDFGWRKGGEGLAIRPQVQNTWYKVQLVGRTIIGSIETLDGQVVGARFSYFPALVLVVSSFSFPHPIAFSSAHWPAQRLLGLGML